MLRGAFAAPAHVVDADGRTPTGVLAALVDSIGGLASGIAALPDWIVTTNLTLRRAPSSLFGADGHRPAPARHRGPPAGPLGGRHPHRGHRRRRHHRRHRLDDDGGAHPASAARPRSNARSDLSMLTPSRTDPAFRAAPAEFFALRDGGRPGEVVLDIADRIAQPLGHPPRRRR